MKTLKNAMWATGPECLRPDGRGVSRRELFKYAVALFGTACLAPDGMEALLRALGQRGVTDLSHPSLLSNLARPAASISMDEQALSGSAPTKQTEPKDDLRPPSAPRVEPTIARPIPVLSPDRKTLTFPGLGTEIGLQEEVYVGNQFIGVSDETILRALSYDPQRMVCPSWVVPYNGTSEGQSFIIPATPGSMFKLKDFGGNPNELFNSTLLPLSSENPPWLDVTGATARIIFGNGVEAYFCSQNVIQRPNSSYGDVVARNLAFFGQGTMWKGYYVLVKPIRGGPVIEYEDILKYLTVVNYNGKDLIMARLPIAMQKAPPQKWLPVVAKK